MAKTTARQYQFRRDYCYGFPGAIIRIAIVAPLALYHAIAQRHWNVIKDHEILRSGIYDMEIVTGERLAAKWGRFAFFYSLAVWFPSVVIAAPINIIFSIIDIVVTAYLWKASNHHRSYASLNFEWCNDVAAWPPPTGANETFFAAAARLNATVATPVGMCKSFVLERRYGLSVSILYTFIIVIGILAAINAAAANYKHGRNQHKSIISMARPIKELPRFFIILFSAFFYFIPVWLFRFLPFSIKSRTRYARRYTFKTGQAAEEEVETKIKMSVLQKKSREEGFVSSGKLESSPLAEFLGIYDMLMLVVQDLHYVDMVNLSRTSKSLREIVLPAEDPRRIAHLKMYTCEPTLKEQCWLCMNMICSGCCKYRALPQTNLYWHLDKCQPYCTPCYREHVIFKKPYQRLDVPICNCAPPTMTPNLLQTYMRGAKYYADRRAQLPRVTRYVCRECDVLTDKVILERRERRTRAVLKIRELEKRGHGWGRCMRNGCDREIEDGPRWWVCLRCSQECTCGLHAAWGKKAKRKEDEKEKEVSGDGIV